jgi:hypothetical protein
MLLRTKVETKGVAAGTRSSDVAVEVDQTGWFVDLVLSLHVVPIMERLSFSASRYTRIRTGYCAECP